jgi:hypothetical protein
VSQEARDDAIRQKENAMMRTLLFATAAITVLVVAAPAFARGHFRHYGYYGEYDNGYVKRHRVPRAVDLDPDGYHGYVPNNWATYCGQLPKAC